MKAYFGFPSLPEEMYTAPTRETMVWTGVFAAILGLMLWFCHLQGKPPKR